MDTRGPFEICHVTLDDDSDSHVYRTLSWGYDTYEQAVSNVGEIATNNGVEQGDCVVIQVMCTAFDEPPDMDKAIYDEAIRRVEKAFEELRRVKPSVWTAADEPQDTDKVIYDEAIRRVEKAFENLMKQVKPPK